MVKSYAGIVEDVECLFPRESRPAMSTKALAVLVVVVVIVGGAVGISYPKSREGPVTSSVSTSSTASYSVSSSATATNSSSSTSVVSNTTTSSSTLSAPLFNFTLTSSPDTILIAPGDVMNYSSIVLIPRPNQLQGNAIMNAGIGSELVVLNATAPGGMYVHFFGSTLINRIYEEAGAGTVMSTEMQLVAPKSIAPGNYTVTVEGSSGSFSVTSSFTVQVVKYLIIARYYTFEPRDLNVTVGSTVYWINLSDDKNQPYDVIFTTINVHSPTLNPNPAFDSFSYTFNAPGVYPYYCAYLAAMKGNVTVTG